MSWQPTALPQCHRLTRLSEISVHPHARWVLSEPAREQAITAGLSAEELGAGVQGLLENGFEDTPEGAMPPATARIIRVYPTDGRQERPPSYAISIISWRAQHRRARFSHATRLGRCMHLRAVKSCLQRVDPVRFVPSWSVSNGSSVTGQRRRTEPPAQHGNTCAHSRWLIKNMASCCKLSALAARHRGAGAVLAAEAAEHPVYEPALLEERDRYMAGRLKALAMGDRAVAPAFVRVGQEDSGACRLNLLRRAPSDLSRAPSNLSR